MVGPIIIPHFMEEEIDTYEVKASSQSHTAETGYLASTSAILAQRLTVWEP